MRGADWRMRTRRSPSPYGSGLSSTPLMTLKIAVLAPMPRPSEDRDQREAAMLQQRADAEAKVLHQFVHRAAPLAGSCRAPTRDCRAATEGMARCRDDEICIRGG